MNTQEAEQYWAAAISTLPTEEKRNAAWSFYSKWFSDPGAGGLFAGMMLLLEAHHTMLLTLPESFSTKVVTPLQHQLAGLTENIGALKTFESRAFQTLETANQASEKAAQLCNLTAAATEKTILSAFENIDSNGLAQKVSNALIFQRQ